MFRNKVALTVLVVLAGVSAARGSSASFVISGTGVDLGKAEEVIEKGVPQPPRFRVKVEVGKPFTLTARGMVHPRGVAKGQPSAPDAGAWSFAEKDFKKLVPEKKADKTEIAVILRPTAVGRSRVRFTGKILGYERTFDVLVEVVARKKE